MYKCICIRIYAIKCINSVKTRVLCLKRWFICIITCFYGIYCTFMAFIRVYIRKYMLYSVFYMFLCINVCFYGKKHVKSRICALFTVYVCIHRYMHVYVYVCFYAYMHVLCIFMYICVYNML